MSGGRTWDRAFDSYADFYQHAYGQHIAVLQPMGRLGATLIEAHQSAGDWSDAPTPDLIISCLVSRPVGFSVDLGAGRFSQVSRSGDAILVAPGAGSTILMEGAHVCRLVALPYRAFRGLTEDRGATLPDDGDFGQLHAGLLRDTRLSGLLDALWRETKAGGAHGALLVDGLLLQLAGLLLRLRDGGASGTGGAKGGLAPHHLRLVRDYLEERLAEDVTLAELAALTGLSPHHLCRAFKQSTGLPPHRWRQARRIERAREMLERPDVSIAEIAAACGFASQQHFTTAFKNHVGATPSAYRRERRI